MNRRDFLLLRTDSRSRVVELSCERLYMRYVDTQVTGAQGGNSTGPADMSRWGGEPPAAFDKRTLRQLFEDLDHELRDADVLRVVDSQWLARDDLRRDFENLLASFRARGGRVEVEP